MSNVIRFLESMGTRQPSAADYADSVADLDIGAQQRKALLDRDHSALSYLLGGRAKAFCSVFAEDENV